MKWTHVFIRNCPSVIFIFNWYGSLTHGEFFQKLAAIDAVVNKYTLQLWSVFGGDTQWRFNRLYIIALTFVSESYAKVENHYPLLFPPPAASRTTSEVLLRNLYMEINDCK